MNPYASNAPHYLINGVWYPTGEVYGSDGYWYPDTFADDTGTGVVWVRVPWTGEILATVVDPPPPPAPPVPPELLGPFRGVRNSSPDPNEPYYPYLTDPRYDPPSIWPAQPGEAWVQQCDEAGNICHWELHNAFNVNQGGGGVFTVVRNLVEASVGGAAVMGPVGSVAAAANDIQNPGGAVDTALRDVGGAVIIATPIALTAGAAAFQEATPELLSGPLAETLPDVLPETSALLEAPEYAAPELLSGPAEALPETSALVQAPDFVPAQTPTVADSELISEPVEVSSELISEPPAEAVAAAVPAPAAVPVSAATGVGIASGVTSILTRVNDLIKHATPAPPKPAAPPVDTSSANLQTGSLVKYAAVGAALLSLLS